MTPASVDSANSSSSTGRDGRRREFFRQRFAVLDHEPHLEFHAALLLLPARRARSGGILRIARDLERGIVEVRVTRTLHDLDAQDLRLGIDAGLDDGYRVL